MRKIVVLFVLLTAGYLFAADTTVNFATGEWAPYTGEKLQGNGAAAEIVAEACKAAGINAKFNFYPWKRAEKNVSDGVEFATFPYIRTQEREPFFDFSDPIFNVSIGILKYTGNAKTKDIKYSKIDDLKGYTIGITAGSDAITNPLKKAGIKVEETPTLDQSVEKLKMGRIDLIIDGRAVVLDAVRKMYPNDQKNFQFLDKDFIEKIPYLMLVSKKYPNSKDIMKKFNEGLKKIKDNGTLKKICDKYGITM